jgi:predicted RNase H-like HicB family nuclease
MDEFGTISSRKRSRSVPLRCIIERKGDLYLAECIDLDIAVTADSLEAAQKGLMDAIQGYLESVFSLGEQDRMIPRPAPISHRIRYYLSAIPGLLGQRYKVDSSKLLHSKPAYC